MIRSSMRRYRTYPPHRAPVRAPVGALCEGSSMRTCRSELYAKEELRIRFIGKPGVQDEGVDMWLNLVLTPG